MVGVPRSNGCSLCVKRRVRCDEARPACGNCVKYGADCPGYDRGFKFVSGKHAVRSRGRQAGANLGRRPKTELYTTSSSSSASSSEDPVGSTAPSPKHGQLRFHNWKVPLTVAVSTEPYREEDWEQLPEELQRMAIVSADVFQKELLQINTPLPSPKPNTSQYIGMLLGRLRSTVSSEQLIIMSGWMDHINGRLGRQTLLDSATCSIVLQVLGKAIGDEHAIATSRTLYGKSLVALQKALNHPTEWKSAETLCSTTMLCLFELFAGTSSPDSWMNHAAGVSRLMRLRGPKAYQRDWDKSILLSFRGMICMHTLFTGQDCFLAEPEWAAVCRHDGSPVETGPDSPNYRVEVTDDYFLYLAKLPPILRHALALRDANAAGVAVDMAQVMLLVQAAEAVREGFASWYPKIQECYPPPIDVPSEDPASIYPVVLRFRTPWVGALHLGYWASMLIVQECLNQCHYPVDYRDLNRQFAQNIFRSIETVGGGVMGPFRCGYSMRIAYEFADDRTKEWLRTWLLKFEKTYAATSVRNFQ